jgi:uncharacterized protein
MSLYKDISTDMIDAMKNKDKEKLSTIRLLKSAIDLNKINSKNDEVSDDTVIDIVSKQIKTHRESIEQFLKGGREDLANNLEKEIKLLEKYLPEQLTEEEIEKELNKIYSKIEPVKSNIGQIMKEAKETLKGKADFKKVSELIQKKLNS